MTKNFSKSLIPVFLISSLALYKPVNLPAQNFNIETFTVKDGLANDNVRSMAVDSLGFLWIATWDGISRYDGHTFTNYFHNPDDSLSLPFFSIWDIVVDGGNNLWIITDTRNVGIYDRKSDIFRRIEFDFDSLPESYDNISIDESGYLWLINPGSLFRYDFRKNKFDKYIIFDRQGSLLTDLASDYFSISVPSDNNLWLIHNKVYEFERTLGNQYILKNQYTVDNHTPRGSSDFNYIFWYKLFVSISGKKWLFSNTGLYLLDEESGVFREFRNPPPLDDFQGKNLFYWSWYDDGIYVYNPEGKKLSHIPQEYSQLVKGILCQNKNLIWFSNFSLTGASMGLYKVVLTPDYFKKYPVLAGKNDMPAIYAITKDKYNRIWVGMRGNNPINMITQDLKSNSIKVPEFKTIENPGTVRSLTMTPDGIYIGFLRELFLFYSFVTGEFTRPYLGPGYFRPVAVTKEGKIYHFVENGKLGVYNPVLKKTEAIIDFQPESPVYKILRDESGIVWAGSNNSALVKIDPNDNKATTYYISADNYNIEDICTGDNGDLWLATLGAGVCNFNPSTGKKTFYTTSSGLSNNITYGILKDNSGNIWVSTNTGISRINPRTGKILTFGPAEGLNIAEFNSGAVYKTTEGEFLMGGMGGLVGFYPDLINRYETESGNQRIIISEVRSSGSTKYFKRSLSKPDTIILEKGENNFKVFFSSTDFIHSDKTIYRYKLSEVSNEWAEADSRNRNISYANLKPGWYHFHLQATDRLGSWCATKELRIRIKPYYYQTLLFRLTVPAFLIILIGCTISLYIKQLKQRETQKQNTLRLQTLRGQMNPHFIFNSLNSINYFISNNDKLSANRYIADFSKLIRSILHNLSHDSITLDKEIESIGDYLKIEHIRFGDKFEFEIKVDEAINTNLKVSPGMIQPFVENAIWHGIRGLSNRKGRIKVWFGSKNGILTCTVKDDGVGREKAEMMKPGSDLNRSKGISIALERLRILNGLQGSHYQISITDLYPGKAETGTMVEIDIPVIKE